MSAAIKHTGSGGAKVAPAKEVKVVSADTAPTTAPWLSSPAAATVVKVVETPAKKRAAPAPSSSKVAGGAAYAPAAAMIGGASSSSSSSAGGAAASSSGGAALAAAAAAGGDAASIELIGGKAWNTKPPADYADYKSKVAFLTMYNFKGGVGKTTQSLMLAEGFAAAGLKVLLVDADAQCSLTEFALHLRLVRAGHTVGSLRETLPKPHTLLQGFNMAFNSGLRPASTVEVCRYVRPGGLSAGVVNLLMGDEMLSEAEDAIATADTVMDMIGIGDGARNTPGALYHLLLMTAQKLGSDVVLIDLNPSLSKLNKLAIAASDAFVLPAFGDFFSHRSVETLTLLLPEFVKMAMVMRSRSLVMSATRTATKYPLPLCRPQFLGSLIRLSLATTVDAAPAAQRGWISRVQESVGELRAQLRNVTLEQIGWTPELAATVGGAVQLALDDAVLTAEDVDPDTCTIGFVPDHFSLNGFSHALSIPTPMLDIKLVKDVCSWSKRSATYYRLPAKRAYFKFQPDFKKRLPRCRSAARDYVKRVLSLLAATPTITGTELGAAITAAAAAEWVKRVDGPAFTSGPHPEDFNPFQTYPDSRGIEKTYAATHRAPTPPPEEGSEGDEDDEEGEDNDGEESHANPAAAGAASAAAPTTPSVSGHKRPQQPAAGGLSAKKARV